MEPAVYAHLAELARRLVSATIAGQVDWRAEPEDTYRYEGGRGIVSVKSRDKDGEQPYKLVVFNESGERIDELVSQWDDGDRPAPWNQPLADLYHVARRRALGAEAVVDALIDELPSAFSGEEPPVSG
jgi:hypothetical protein